MNGKDIKEVDKLLNGKLRASEIVALLITSVVGAIVIYSAVLSIKANRLAIKEMEQNKTNTPKT